jgi:hypothetical protein
MQAVRTPRGRVPFAKMSVTIATAAIVAIVPKVLAFIIEQARA